MNGSSIRLSLAAAPPWESSLIDRVNVSSKSLLSPSSPGFSTSSMDHRSFALFSNGVPVSATLTGAPNARAARAARVSGFLTICASSSTSAENPAASNASYSLTKSEYPVTTTSAAAHLLRNSPPAALSAP